VDPVYAEDDPDVPLFSSRSPLIPGKALLIISTDAADVDPEPRA